MSKVGACLDGTLTWIGNNKLVTFLGLVAFSLMVSTWTLAAINVNLNKEIDQLHHDAAAITTTTNGPSSESTTPTNTPTSSSTEPSPSPEIKMNLRLSEYIIPTHYDLLIHPDLTPSEAEGTGWFNGTVKIQLHIQETTEEIILHSHLLNITSVKFTGPDSSVVVSNFKLDSDMEQLKVTLNRRINPVTDCELEIDFEGSMRDKIVGLYRSSYKDEDGNNR